AMASFHGLPHLFGLGGGPDWLRPPAHARDPRGKARARARASRFIERRTPNGAGRPGSWPARRAGPAGEVAGPILVGRSTLPLRFLGGELIERLVRVRSHRVAYRGGQLLHLVQVVLEGVHLERREGILGAVG